MLSHMMVVMLVFQLCSVVFWTRHWAVASTGLNIMGYWPWQSYEFSGSVAQMSFFHFSFLFDGNCSLRGARCCTKVTKMVWNPMKSESEPMTVSTSISFVCHVVTWSCGAESGNRYQDKHVSQGFSPYRQQHQETPCPWHVSAGLCQGGESVTQLTGRKHNNMWLYCSYRLIKECRCAALGLHSCFGFVTSALLL